MIYQNISSNDEKLKNINEKDLKYYDSMVDVNIIEPSSLNEYKICIPKAYSREETKNMPMDAEKVPHYELYIERQIGTVRNRRSTYIFWKLPKTGRMVAIELFMDGGVDFKPDERKYILRETDELDRRIVLGFCLGHQEALRYACYSDKKDIWLAGDARHYKASDMPKRIKRGKWDCDFTDFYIDLEPYEEMGIFSECKFI